MVPVLVSTVVSPLSLLSLLSGKSGSLASFSPSVNVGGVVHVVPDVVSSFPSIVY